MEQGNYSNPNPVKMCFYCKSRAEWVVSFKSLDYLCVCHFHVKVELTDLSGIRLVRRIDTLCPHKNILGECRECDYEADIKV